ncbi:hypothetical protein MUP77_13585 [Candidatus Bathyarchaeota archaeon]|nr:hypothetical protein [Candidatus Bathyarchaeota archaeon]
MPTVLINGKLQVLGDNHCFICDGTLKESETECPVCKARREEVQVLKARLAAIEPLLQRPKQNQKEVRIS